MSFITQEDARKFSASESLILPQLARIVCLSHIPALWKNVILVCFLVAGDLHEQKIG